jgi:MFS family permease
LGSLALGRLSDRFGILLPLVLGTTALSLGFCAASFAGNIGWFTLAQGLLIGVGSSATFGPLLADVSLWVRRRRGIAIAIIASGNYLAGTIWPPVVQHFIDSVGWRQTYLAIGVFCVLSMLPLALILKPRAPISERSSPGLEWRSPHSLGLSPLTLQVLLIVAGLACCVAMSMPQVHLVAYCGDLGYGPARGAQMLSLMLGFGIVSRLTMGWICDHIGGLRTLRLGSALQGVALLLYLPFDSLFSLYVISALFGLFQGGIVPSYAIIVREYFSPKEAGTRVSVVLTATMFGMALGGWMSGALFDWTGSYKAAFVNGILWNLLNLSIAAWLLHRRKVWRTAHV